MALSVIFIEIVGTVNHPNMKMNPEELMESKKAARIIGLLEGSIICSCILLGVDRIFISYMAIAVILCAALLCIAKIRKQEVKEDEKINRTVLKLVEHMARNEKARMDRFPPSCTGIWHQPKRPIRK